MTPAIARVQFGKDFAEDDPNRGFRSPRDFLSKVMEAGQGQRVDTRLEPLRVAAAGSDEQSGNEGQFGAFLVPVGFSPSVWSIPVSDPTAEFCTPIPMNRPIVNIPARVDKDHTTSVSGGLIVTRKREAVLETSSRMSVEQVTLHANSLFGLTYATSEIVQDSPEAFMQILQLGFGDEFASRMLIEKLFGAGGGEPFGVLNSPCLITIAKEPGQAAKTIVTENIDKMAGQCWHYSTRAIWLANEDTFPILQGLTRSVGVGGSLAMYVTWDDDGHARLLGRPLFFTEFCKAPGTVGDLVLGTWSEFLWGTLTGLQGLESIHIRFEPHEAAFKFWLRNDGAAWWRATLLSRNSTVTRSPFVTLAARA